MVLPGPVMRREAESAMRLRGHAAGGDRRGRDHRIRPLARYAGFGMAAAVLHFGQVGVQGHRPSVAARAASDALHLFRHDLGRSLRITSAYRSPGHNSKVGGASDSLHMHGDAFDVQMVGVAAAATSP